MKRLIGLVLGAVLATGCITTREVVVEEDPAPAPISPTEVHAQLSPYGTWVYVAGVGDVWQPSPAYVGASFYPYATGGRWTMVNGAWWFDSSAPFGPVVYHYGRWHYDPFYGWVWVPGYQWAPAWVSWRSGGGYVGWCPMGPSGVYVRSQPRYVYVQENDFTRRDPYVRALPPSRMPVAERSTRVHDGSRGPSVAGVSSAHSGAGSARAYSDGGSRGASVIREDRGPQPAPRAQRATRDDGRRAPTIERHATPAPTYERRAGPSPSYEHRASPSFERRASPAPGYARPSSPSYQRPSSPAPAPAPNRVRRK